MGERVAVAPGAPAEAHRQDDRRVLHEPAATVTPETSLARAAGGGADRREAHVRHLAREASGRRR